LSGTKMMILTKEKGVKTMISIKKIFYLFAIIALLAMSLSATEYYVKNGGNDAASGLDDDNAWETIAKVNGESFSGDDIIYFKRGDTWREQLIVPDSGTSGHQITFGAYGEGADPIVNGSDLITTWVTAEPASPIADANFEGNNLDEFDSKTDVDNDMSASADAKLGGTNYGLKLLVDDTNDMHGTINISPPTDTIRMRIYFDISNLTMADGDDFLGPSIRISGGAFRIAGFSLLRSGANYQIRPYVNDDSGVHNGTATTFTKADEHYVEIQVTKESVDTAADGTCDWWLDGTHIEEINGALDNIGNWAIINGARIAARNLDAGTSGNLYFDELYVVGSGEVIGPVTGANVWKAACDTEPKIVCFDGTVGTKVDNVIDVDSANKWYWEDIYGGYLYVYATEDPDGAIDVEAGQRDYGITGTDKSYITIEGLRIEKTNSDAIYVTTSGANSTNWTILNNNIRNVSGCGIWCVSSANNLNNHIVSGNTIYYWNRDDDSNHRAIGYFLLGGDDISITNNTIEGDVAYGVNLGTFRNGIEVAAGARPIIQNNDVTGCDHGLVLGTGCTAWNVSYNYVHQTGDDSTWNRSDDATGVFSYNILVDSSDNCIDTGTGAGDPGKYYNNVCYDSGSNTQILNMGRAAVYKNNIFYMTDRSLCYLADEAAHTIVTNCTFDNNSYYGFKANQFAYSEVDMIADLAEWQLDFSQDANSIDSDPLMTDPSNDDFTLQVGSPCINAGTDVGLTEDYAGNSIIDSPDIGAYEYQANAKGRMYLILNKGYFIPKCGEIIDIFSNGHMLLTNTGEILKFINGGQNENQKSDSIYCRPGYLSVGNITYGSRFLCNKN